MLALGKTLISAAPAANKKKFPSIRYGEYDLQAWK
jgi:hypothetical protein